MSLRGTKGLARTPPGSLKLLNTGKGVLSRVSAFHSVVCETEVLDASLVRVETEGSFHGCSCLNGDAAKKRGVCCCPSVIASSSGVEAPAVGMGCPLLQII